MIEKGAVLAGYRIDGILAHGGMGVLYRATQLSLQRTVALKVLPETLGDDPVFRERFRREGMLQAAIDHPHIVTVYEAGESEYGLFLAMRLIQGPNLKNLIVDGSLDARLTLRLLSQVAGALDTAHEAGLVHRDIKPQNILVGTRDHAYLADFGLTRALNSSGLTRQGEFMGTLDYISPEQIRGEPPSVRSDIYALAAVLYECLTGDVPFPHETDAAVLFSHISDRPPSVVDRRPELPPAIDAVVAKGMSKEPRDRQASASTLVTEAEVALAGALDLPSPATAGDTAARPQQVTPTRPRPVDAASDPSLRGRTAAKPVRVEQEPATVQESEPAPAAASAPETVGVVTAAPIDPEPEVMPPAPPPVDFVPAAPEAGATAATAAVMAPPPEVAVLAPQAPPAEPPDAGVQEGFTEAHQAQAEPEAKSGLQEGTEAAVPVEAAEGAVPDAVQAVPGPEPEPSSEVVVDRSVSRRKPLTVLVAALALAGLGIAGYVIGGSGSSEEPEPANDSAETTTASAGNLAVRAPGDWRPADEGEVPGIQFSDPLRLESRRGDVLLVAGVVEAAGSLLLPESLVSQLPAAPQADPVGLGDLEAYRYAGLEPEGFDGVLDVYVVPTSVGAATVACVGATADADLAGCESIATTLEIEGAETYPVGPTKAYAKSLSGVMKKFNRERAKRRAQLARANTPRAQSEAAGALGRSYTSAARSLDGLEVSPQAETAHDALVDALRAAGVAYGDLAAAARDGSDNKYDAAAERVRQREAEVEAALSAFEDLGYEVG